MGEHIRTGPVHHVHLTVTDIDRACAFYTEVLGFRKVMDVASGVFLTNGAVGLGLGPRTDHPAGVAAAARADEGGLDHVSFTVDSRAALDDAARILDQRGVPHGEIRDLGPALGIYSLVFRGPENVQLELSAPRRDPSDGSDARDGTLPAGLPV